MAEQVTTVLTVRVAGTDRVVKSLAEAEKAAAELRQEIANVPKGGREFVRLNQDLERLENGFKKSTSEGRKTGGALGGLKTGFAGAAKGAAGLAKGLGAIGLAAQGIFAIVGLVKSIGEALLNTVSIGDEVERFFGGLSLAAQQLRNAFGFLLKGDLSAAWKAATTDAQRAFEVGQKLTGQLQQLEDDQRALRIEEAKGEEQVQRLLLQARDRTKSDRERIALLKEAGEVEQKLQNRRELLAERNLKLTGAFADANQGDKEAIERRQEAEAEYYKTLAAGVTLRETIQNRINLLEQQAAADAEAARVKRQEQIEKQLDTELAAFISRKDLDLALLEGREDTAAKLARIDINLAKERERIRIEELKGIEVDANEVTRIELTAARARQEVALEALGKIRMAEQELSDFRSNQAREAAQAESQDLTLPIEQRIDAVLRLRAMELERIEANRAAALSERNLTRGQIDLINAQAEAAIEATEGITDAAEESLLELQGSVIARIFGVGSEEQIEQTKAALRELADAGVQILSDLGTTLFDAQTQRLEAQAAQFAEAVAAAEQESADAATRTAELQSNLAQADVSQRSRIIGLIKEQQAAQARADSAAAAARAREVAAKTKAALGQRRADSVQALVNAALAITRVFASTPPPASFILAAATAATTGAQIAAINAQPLPTFAQGGFTGSGTGPIDSTGERIAGITHAGEYVVPRRVLAIPQARGVVDYLEGLRTFAQGGFTTPDQATTTTTPAAAPVMAAPTVQVELVLSDVASGLQRVQLAERKATL